MIMINTLPKSLIEAATRVITPDTHIDVDGEMKHKYNSEGKLIHHTDDGIKNFHRWFGDSKAVDESGRPKVFYHGTNNVFNTFNTVSNSVNSTTFGDVDTVRHGAFLTDNKDFAKQYGSKVNEVYLKLRTPHKFNNDTRHDFADSLDAFDDRENWISAKHGRHTWGLHENDVGKKFVSYLKSKGHDSHIFHEDLETPDGDFESNTHVVFHPNQIKSAIGNNGDFSHEKNTIHESTEPLKFHVDNPGGEWLQYKQDSAKEWIRKHGDENTSLGKGITGAVTGYFNKPMNLPVQYLSKLPGAMGEEQYRGSTTNQKMKNLESDIGSPDNFDSKKHPIFVAVNHMGHAYVMEGNHRLEYARKNGISHIHTEVRYFNGGETADKLMHPSTITKLHKESTND